MNLKKNFLLNDQKKKLFKKKFINCSFYSLIRGDYFQIKFFLYDKTRKGGLIARLNKITAILLKKTIRLNIITIVVSTMYKHEKVKLRLLLIHQILFL